MSPWFLGGGLAFGFALGSVPAGYLVSRASGRGDVRTRGSGSTGASNVLRVLGPAPALVTLALDAAKGAAATILAPAIFPGGDVPPEVVGVAAVLGHVFTPWLGFRGGKGAATAAGMLAPLAPVAVISSLVVFGVAMVIGRRVSVGSIAGALSFPGWAGLFGAAEPTVLAGIATAGIVLVGHRENVARLVSGREPKIRLPGSEKGVG